jgi:hypothetical protein
MVLKSISKFYYLSMPSSLFCHSVENYSLLVSEYYNQDPLGLKYCTAVTWGATYSLQMENRDQVRGFCSTAYMLGG